MNKDVPGLVYTISSSYFRGDVYASTDGSIDRLSIFIIDLSTIPSNGSTHGSIKAPSFRIYG